MKRAILAACAAVTLASPALAESPEVEAAQAAVDACVTRQDFSTKDRPALVELIATAFSEGVAPRNLGDWLKYPRSEYPALLTEQLGTCAADFMPVEDTGGEASSGAETAAGCYFARTGARDIAPRVLISQAKKRGSVWPRMVRAFEVFPHGLAHDAAQRELMTNGMARDLYPLDGEAFIACAGFRE